MDYTTIKNHNKIIQKFDSPYWIVQTDEIGYYDASCYNKDGVFCKEGWTSMWDIGQIYAGHEFTKSTYISIEDSFVKTLIDIFRCAGCNFVNLYYMRPQKIRLSELKKSPLSDSDSLLYAKWITKYQNKYRVHIDEMDDIIRLCLREWINVCLVNNCKHIYVRFGYDYYVSILSKIDYSSLENIIKKYKLHLNARNKIVLSKKNYDIWEKLIQQSIVYRGTQILDIPIDIYNAENTIDYIKHCYLAVYRILRLYQIKRACYVQSYIQRNTDDILIKDAVIKIRDKTFPKRKLQKTIIKENDLFLYYADSTSLYIDMPVKSIPPNTLQE